MKLRTDNRLLRASALAALAVGGQAIPAMASNATTPTTTTLPPTAPLLVATELNNPADPILWTGTFRDSAGRTGIGSLAVSARGNSGDSKQAVLPLGQTTVGANGVFTIRLPYRADVAALADKAGAVTFMLTSASVTDFSMTMVTLKYVPELNQWGAAPDVSVYRAATAAAQTQGLATASMPTLKPASADVASVPKTTSDTSGPVTNTPQPQVYPSAPSPCQLWGRGDLPPVKSYVGQTNIEKAGGWQLAFQYENTETTSNDVGVELSGAFWGVAGSTTVESTVSTGFDTTVYGRTDTATGKKHWIRASLYRYDWRCWTNPYSPPTGNPGGWPAAVTIEKGAWYSDSSYDDFGSWGVPSCTSTDGDLRDWEVSPNTEVRRDNGTVTTLANSFEATIPENPAKFHGGIKATSQLIGGHNVTNRFKNTTASNKKHLCGTTDNPLRGHRADNKVVATSRIT